jgi:hypothetical protein
MRRLQFLGSAIGSAFTAIAASTSATPKHLDAAKEPQRKRILLLIDPTRVDLELFQTGWFADDMGVEGFIVPAFMPRTELPIALFDLDGLPSAEHGRIKELLTKYLKGDLNADAAARDGQ